MTPQMRILRGTPDEVEVAALVAGLAAVAAGPGTPGEDAQAAEWTNRARSIRGAGSQVTAGSFGGQPGRCSDTWRWSLHT